MQYKVVNLLCDMKLIRDGKVVVIKRGKDSLVSAQEYQYLSQVYGMSVKGEKEIVVRVTEPAKIEEIAVAPVSNKKRKHKRS